MRNERAQDKKAKKLGFTDKEKMVETLFKQNQINNFLDCVYGRAKCQPKAEEVETTIEDTTTSVATTTEVTTQMTTSLEYMTTSEESDLTKGDENESSKESSTAAATTRAKSTASSTTTTTTTTKSLSWLEQRKKQRAEKRVGQEMNKCGLKRVVLSWYIFTLGKNQSW